MESESKQSQSTVARLFDVLETLAGAPHPMTLAELGDATEIPKASLHRILQLVQARGYVTQEDQGGRYAAGIRCFELGAMWAENLDIRATAAPHLQALNQLTQETVHLGVYEHGDVVYVDRLESPLQVVAKTYIGRRSPATQVSTGRALLAYRETSEIERVLAGPLPAYTDLTVTDPDELRQILTTVREDGYAINLGNYRTEVCGVAAPVRDHTGGVVAAIGICTPLHRFGDDRIGELRDAAVRTAVEISTALGGPTMPVTSTKPAVAGADKPAKKPQKKKTASARR